MTKFSLPLRKLWLTTTGTALGLLLLSLVSQSHANEPLQFGQPLPGRPRTTVPEPPSPAPAVREAAPSNTSAPRRRRPTATRRDRPSPRTASQRQTTTRPPQTSSATASTGGWDVHENTTGVYRSPETLPARSQPNRAISTPPLARSLNQPIATNPPTGQGYTVYVLGDRLSLLDQVSQITPSAAFTTYNQQTAISAGNFNRSIDAEARVRELSQLGLKGIIAPPAQTPPQSAPRTYPSFSADPDANTAPVDPAQIFDNFDSRIPNPQSNGSVQAIASRLPIPRHGQTPPISRKNRNRRLPAPPPSLQQQITLAQSPRPSRPAISPLFRQTQARTTSAQHPLSTSRGTYYLNLPLNNQTPRQLTQRLTTLGIPPHKITQQSNTAAIAIGPFNNLSESTQWKKRLQSSNLTPQLLHNGWVIDSP